MHRDRNRNIDSRKIRDTGVPCKFLNQSVWAVAHSPCLLLHQISVLSFRQLVHWLFVAKKIQIAKITSAVNQSQKNYFMLYLNRACSVRKKATTQQLTVTLHCSCIIFGTQLIRFTKFSTSWFMSLFCIMKYNAIISTGGASVLFSWHLQRV